MHFTKTLLCAALLALPLVAHAEGKAGGTNTYTDDQVRTFTKTETLTGGIKATATILALHKHETNVNNVFSQAFADLRSLAAQFSTNDPNSEIARINSRAGSEPVKVSAGMIKLLDVAKKARRATGGSFDIVKEGGTGEDIKLNNGAQTVQFIKTGMKIDVTAVVNGFLADRLMQTIWDANIDNAMVEVGSVTRSIGNDLVGPWRTVIADMTGQYAGRGVAISFSNASAATVTVGAKTPKANERGANNTPATRCRSATVIAKDATTAQALASAIYELGPDEGLALANRVPQVRAIIRDNAGNLVKSPGL